MDAGVNTVVRGVALLALVATAGGCAGTSTSSPASGTLAAPSATELNSAERPVSPQLSPLGTTLASQGTAIPALTFSPDTVTQITLPALGGGLTVVDDALWDSTDAGVVRIDPDTGTVSQPISGPTNTAFAGGHLWAGGPKMLNELDATSGDVVQEFELDNNAFYLAATDDAVWVTDTFASVVQRLDPSNGEVVATIETPSTPKGTELSDDSVWVACDGAAKVIRIDTETNKIVAEIDVGSGPHNIAIGGDWVWVTSRHSSTLSKIDPATNSVVATVEMVGTSPAVGVVVNEGSVWVALPGGIAEVSSNDALITRRFSVPGAAFYDLEVMDGQLWASDANSPTLYGFDVLGTHP